MWRFTQVSLFFALTIGLNSGCVGADDQTISDNVIADASGDDASTDAGTQQDASPDTSLADTAPNADTAAAVLDAAPQDTATSPEDTATQPDTTPPEPDTTAPPEDTRPEPDPVTCALPTAFMGEYKEVNTWMGDVARVSFRVPDLPAGVTSAQLMYNGYDVDRPGSEGWIQVNGNPRLELPADPALDNAGRDFTIDITGQTVPGANQVEFLAHDNPAGSYFRISEVRIEATGPGLVCPEPPEEPEPTGNGVERTMNYRQATYSQRRNWVLDCRDYAYSARGDEHEECDSTYNPNGTTHGRATFVFENVIADRYEVRVEGRHTTNRNPADALWIVNGIERRISQRSGTDYVYDLHGVYDLSGRVEVVLDSTREVGSDSVRNVQLRPVR